MHNADYATIAGSLWQDVVYMDPPTEFTPLPSICKCVPEFLSSSRHCPHTRRASRRAVWPHCRFIVLKVSPSFNAEEFAASLRPEVADAVATACDLAGVRVVTLKHASSGSGGAEPPLKRSKA